ncbi:MAG: hypothetical protein OXC30_01020 [Alphaproteobacteria bacterium]|nr:hypothetical protein [Alphaproteobacteria bacterium]
MHNTLKVLLFLSVSVISAAKQDQNSLAEENARYLEKMTAAMKDGTIPRPKIVEIDMHKLNSIPVTPEETMHAINDLAYYAKSIAQYDSGVQANHEAARKAYQKNPADLMSIQIHLTMMKKIIADNAGVKYIWTFGILVPANCLRVIR